MGVETIFDAASKLLLALSAFAMLTALLLFAEALIHSRRKR